MVTSTIERLAVPVLFLHWSYCWTGSGLPAPVRRLSLPFFFSRVPLPAFSGPVLPAPAASGCPSGMARRIERILLSGMDPVDYTVVLPPLLGEGERAVCKPARGGCLP